MIFLKNQVPGKEIILKTTNSIEVSKEFSAKVNRGNGNVIIDSDLTGLK